MPGQYRVFQPLALIIAANRRDMLATGQSRSSTGISACPFIQQRMVELTKILGRVVHTGPIHPKYVLWGCSLAIVQAAPFWVTLPCWRKPMTTWVRWCAALFSWLSMGPPEMCPTTETLVLHSGTLRLLHILLTTSSCRWNGGFYNPGALYFKSSQCLVLKWVTETLGCHVVSSNHGFCGTFQIAIYARSRLTSTLVGNYNKT